jgi:hypothetical protein
VAAVNIARTIKRFVEKRLVPSSIPFDKWHERNNKRIRLDMNFVEVELCSSEEFNRMRAFYEATSNVPYLEHTCKDPAYGPYNCEENRIRLVPVGMARQPASAAELIHAIKSVCACLSHLHVLGYVHCDIRWPNVVVCFGEWVVIDCEYACHLEELMLLAARSLTIKPRYVLDKTQPWTPLFDFYQVGRLLAESAFTDSVAPLAELRDLLLTKQFSEVTIQHLLSMV